MERIHDHVVVATSQCALPAVASPLATPRATALQFTAINTGFEVVTFSADFRASANIQLRFPRGAHSHATSSNRNDNGAPQVDDAQQQLLLFECRVAPFERKTLVHVLKVLGKRAFVRVQFTVQNAASPAVHEIEYAQQHDEQAVLQATKLAQSTYHANSSSLPVHALGNTPQSVTRRCCDDINRFFHANANDDNAQFVDMSFPPKRTSLLGFQDNGGDLSEALYSFCSWKHLHDVMDDATSWSLMTNDKQYISMQSPPQSPQGKLCIPPRLTEFRSPLPGQDALVCALAFLALEKAKWVKLWFGDQLLMSGEADSMQALAAIAMKICDRGMQWKQIVVDLYLPGFPIGSGLMTVSAPLSGEIYASLVQKAYAKLKGSYAAIMKISTIAILRELTGLPWVSVYDSTSESQDEQSNSIRRATLQRIICRRHRHLRSQKKQQHVGSLAASVVSFGRIGDHHCAFPVLFANEQDGVTLQDVESRVRKALGRDSAKHIETRSNGENAEDEKLVAVCDWSDFFKLEPRVWMVFANHSESRRARVKFGSARRHGADSNIQTTCVQFAFSVAEMTSLVIVTQLDAEEKDNNHRSTSHHRFTLAAVEHDFSFTRIPTEAPHAPTSGNELQLVVALGAGEYILSVNIETTTKDAPASENLDTRELLTSEDVEQNLELLFDCIDHDMDGAIVVNELQAFLEMHEAHKLLLHHGSLESFMDRFGRQRQDSTTGDGNELLIDDLRDVYRFLAASHLVDEHQSTHPSNKQQQRYEELIWRDLCCVLHLLSPTRADLSCSSQVELSDDDDGGGDRASIRVDDVHELRCCVHSDAPLVNFLRLPMPLSL